MAEKDLIKGRFFLLTGISITRTGISNKNPAAETGILPKFQVGNGIGTPPLQDPHGRPVMVKITFRGSMRVTLLFEGSKRDAALN